MWQHQPPTAKIAIAVHDEWGRISREEEIDQVCLRTQMRHQAMLGLPSRRKE